MTTSASYAAPSCCDPNKGANGADVFSLTPLTLRSAPTAPEQLKNARPRPQRARIAAPQAMWTGAAAAPAYVATNQVIPSNAPEVPACCAQANPGPVTPQRGCCGPVAPNPAPQQGGCCGRFAPNTTSARPSCCGQFRANAPVPQQSCCAAVAPNDVPRQRGCCGQMQACSGCTGQQLRRAPGFPPAAGSCCSPGTSSAWPSPGVTNLPAAMPAANRTGYTGPTRAGLVKQAVQMTGTTVSLPIPAPFYSSNLPRNLW